MILRLLETIANEAREKAGSDQGALEKSLQEGLDFHVKKLSDITEGRRKEKDALLKEKARHITTEDIHEGFDSKVASSSVISSIQFPLKSSPVCSCNARTSPGYRERKGKELRQDGPY